MTTSAKLLIFYERKRGRKRMMEGETEKEGRREGEKKRKEGRIEGGRERGEGGRLILRLSKEDKS